MNRILPDVTSAMGFSLTLHAGILAVAAFVTPALDETPSTFTADTASYRFLATLTEDATAPPEEDDRAAETEPSEAPDDRERIDSRCGEEQGGSMGNLTAEITHLRYGVQGPADNADPHIAREIGFQPESFESVIGPLHAGGWGSADAPVQPWGRDTALGNDPRSARGSMWGEDIGAAFGSPGSGIGLLRICATCGASGGGPRLPRTGAPGGAIGTERASDLGLR